MVKSREHVTTNGKAAFYACIWPDLMKTAIDNGWAFGLHGSLQSDLDIMAMPWTEDAKPLDVLIDAIRACFTEPDQISYRVDTTTKPNNRAVITIWIWADFYLDINVIKPFKLSVENDNPFYEKTV